MSFKDDETLKDDFKLGLFLLPSEIVLDFITPDKDEILETMSTLSKKVMPEL